MRRQSSARKNQAHGPENGLLFAANIVMGAFVGWQARIMGSQLDANERAWVIGIPVKIEPSNDTPKNVVPCDESPQLWQGAGVGGGSPQLQRLMSWATLSRWC